MFVCVSVVGNMYMLCGKITNVESTIISLSISDLVYYSLPEWVLEIMMDDNF